MADGGYFKAVEHMAAIDSAASRLLQLADVVAGTHTLVGRKMSTAGLERCGIPLFLKGKAALRRL